MQTRLTSNASRHSIIKSAAAAIVAASVFAATSAEATTYNWNQTGTPLSWSTSTNWTANIAGGPSTAGDIAIINTNITANSTISLFNTGDAGSSIKTVGRLDIGDTNSTAAFIIAAGTGGGVLNFDNSGAGAQLNRLSTGSASDSISANVTLSDNLAINNAATAATTLISGGITAATSGTKTITNSGTGTGTVTLSGIIGDGSGTVGFTQSSTTSAVTLTGVNTYTGATIVSAGCTLNIGSGATTGGLAAASAITLGNGATLKMNTTSGSLFLGNALSLSGTTANATLSSSIAANGYSGAVTGTSGQTLTIGGTVQISFSSSTQQLSGFAGTVDILSTTSLRFSTSTTTASLGGTGTTFNVNGTMTTRNAIQGAGGIHVGALTGSGSIVGGGSATTGTDIWIIGEKNIDSLFSGTIVNGSGANLSTSTVVKAGTGILTLSGTNTYTGTTSVTGGTLSFAKQASLYNSTTASWTPTLLSANANATIALGVGDVASGYFDSAAVDTFRTNMNTSTATTGFKTSSILGFDTTNATSGTFTYNSNISNFGTSATDGVSKIGAGTLVLGGTNTYTGATTVVAGTLSVAANANLGAVGTGAAVNLNGGTLQATSTFGLFNGVSGTNNRNLIVNSNSGVDVTSGNTFTIAGLVSGAGILNKTGLGTLELTNNGSFQTGGTTITAGTVSIVGVNSLGGANYGGVTFNGGTLQYASTLQSGSDLSVGGAGVVSGNAITIASGGGAIDTNGNTVTYTQAIGNGGTGSLTKKGAGTLILNTTTNYTGVTTVNNGTLVVAGVNGAINVNTGVLGGTGTAAGAVTVGDVTSGTGITSDAFISPGQSIATFTTSSSLLVNADGEYKFELNSGTLAADKIVANGVTINSDAVFTFIDLGSSAYTSAQSFLVIDNTSGSAISGTFSNLANGSQFTVNGNLYTANYSGGTGNDLVLTAVPEPSVGVMLIAGFGILVVVQRSRRRLSA